MQELIYNQRDIPKSKWRYGLRSSAKVGCGWVATANALVLMGQDVDVEHLIRQYEHQVPILNGNAGTVIWGPAMMLKKLGFSVESAFRMEQFDALCRKSDVCILFYYWRKGWRIGSHFVALQECDGTVQGYNTYTNSTGPDCYGSSLSAFLKEKKYFGCVLFGVRKP